MDGAARREELRLRAQALRLELQGIEAELGHSPPPPANSRPRPHPPEDGRQCLLEELERERTLLRAVLSQVPVQVVAFDTTGSIILQSDKFRELHSLPLHKTIIDSGETEQKLHVCPVRHVLDTGESLEALPLRIECGGRLRHVQLHASPLRDAEGTVTGVIATTVDVSALQQASEEREELLVKVQRQRALLEAIIKHMPGSTIIVLPPHGQVFYVNEVILGIHMGPDEERPVNVSSNPYRTESMDGTPIAPEDWAVVRALMRGETTSGKLVRVHHEKFDGIISMHAAPVYDDNGNIIAAIMMHFDVTDEIRAENELLEHRDRLEDLVVKRTADLEESNRRLRTQRRHLRRLAVELAETEENARKELAISLHDAAAQTLALVLMRAQCTLQAVDEPALRGQLEELVQLSKQSIQEVRAVIAELAPMFRPDSSLVRNLQTLGQQMEARYHYQVQFEPDGAVPVISPQACTAIYRSVRELLINAGKHASATRVSVSCGVADGSLVLILQDDGDGFDPAAMKDEPSGGFGLFSIQEHLAHLGGNMEIESARGQGARFVLRIPLQSSESQ